MLKQHRIFLARLKYYEQNDADDYNLEVLPAILSGNSAQYFQLCRTNNYFNKFKVAATIEKAENTCCGEQLTFDGELAIRFCIKCGFLEEIYTDNGAFIPNRSLRMRYSPLSHLTNLLKSIQAQNPVKLPKKLLDILPTEDITYHSIAAALKKNKFQQYNTYIPYIKYKLLGTQAPKLTDAEISEIKLKFKLIHQTLPANRNSPHLFILRKLILSVCKDPERATELVSNIKTGTDKYNIRNERLWKLLCVRLSILKS